MECAHQMHWEFRAVGHGKRFSEFVQPIKEVDLKRPEVVASLQELVAYARTKGSIRPYLPEIVRDVDPDGIAVPALVVAILEGECDEGDLPQFARLGAAYKVNTNPWRTIALAAMHAVARCSNDTLRETVAALSESPMKVQSVAWGEVPAHLREELNESRAALGTETETEMKPYWQYRIVAAEARLSEEEQYAKEDRGE